MQGSAIQKEGQQEHQPHYACQDKFFLQKYRKKKNH